MPNDKRDFVGVIITGEPVTVQNARRAGIMKKVKIPKEKPPKK